MDIFTEALIYSDLISGTVEQERVYNRRGNQAMQIRFLVSIFRPISLYLLLLEL